MTEMTVPELEARAQKSYHRMNENNDLMKLKAKKGIWIREGRPEGLNVLRVLLIYRRGRM